MAANPTTASALACVILAHEDPQHVRRLIAALDPFPVFLHCDASTRHDVFAAMVEGLPDRCVVMPRMRTGWARWENVVAELEGYRLALATTSASHIAMLSGSDYPLAGPAEVRTSLAELGARSLAAVLPLPYPHWGRRGGFDRLRYRHWAFRKRMLRLPVPRRLPTDVVLAGGSQMKLLARHHAAAVVAAADSRPSLERFWRRSWVADETFVPTLLSTPQFVPDWAAAHLSGSAWFIGWPGPRQKSPAWLESSDFEALATSRAEAALTPTPKLFARKFATESSTPLLDALDARIAEDERRANVAAGPQSSGTAHT